MNPLGSVAYGAQIAAAAVRHHLDPILLAAVAAQETGGPGSDSGANVVGDHGHGHGLFQIDDRWHAFAASAAAMDPAKNAEYAAGMLRGLLDRYGGDVHMALSAYNAGSPAATGTTTDWGGRILGYADSVLAHQARLAGTAGAALAARDAAMPDAAASAGSVNALASIAGLLQGQDIDPASASVTSSSPTALPQPTDYNQHNEQPLGEDLGVGDDADLDATPSRAAPTA